MRRSAGEGGITRRQNGRYQASWTGADGKRHTLSARTRKEAAEKLDLAIRQEQRGARAGGPLRKDRTFAFVSYEQLDVDASNS